VHTARNEYAHRLTFGLSELGRSEEEVSAMDENTVDKWLTRQELADRYGLPMKTPAEWASKGTGPRYAKFGRHVRYLLSDVMDWEREQFAAEKRHPA
jgi:predicted DNA-binding transcriptional regulator AlpA